jgi:hypothetical protein
MTNKVTATFFTKEHFDFETYIDVPRWISYYHQIASTLKLASAQKSKATHGIRNILLIGVGDGIVPTVIKSYGLSVTTYDYSEHLSPDVVGDVREISKYFGRNSFDLIVCCQVLEHIEYSHFKNVLEQFMHISPSAILSLPYCSANLLCGQIRIPKILFKPNLSLPKTWKNSIADSQHFWEIGIKGHSVNKVRAQIQEYYEIKKEFSDSLNTFHRFYLLSRRTENG